MADGNGNFRQAATVVRHARIRRLLFTILVSVVEFIAVVTVMAQEDRFGEVVSQYEVKMQRAAQHWLEKDYTKALDGFYVAREVVAENMSLPADDYVWTGCRTLKTYTVVLARLVEAELYRTQGQTEMAYRLVVQAQEWSVVLEEQAKAWSRVKTRTPAEETLRARWLKRFGSAIHQAQKLSSVLAPD